MLNDMKGSFKSKSTSKFHPS